MRLALISDIHGNLVFLEAVLADIDREQIDEIIFLGDIGTFGPQPREVLHRVRELGCLCIRGNHDTNILDLGTPRQAIQPGSHIHKATEWCAKQLSETDLDYLRTFHHTTSMKLNDDFTMLIFHGSPTSNTDIIRDVTPVVDLEQHFGDHEENLLVGGHTHLQMLRQYEGRLIVNPGSVGMPLQFNPPTPGDVRMLPWAEYAILDTTRSHLSVDMRRVSPDLQAAQAIALEVDSYDAEGWATMWVDI